MEMTAVEIKAARLCALFADLGVSVGYIGNCGVDSRGPYDDRSWRVFTRLRYARGGESVSVFISGADFNWDVVVSQLTRIRAEFRARPHDYLVPRGASWGSAGWEALPPVPVAREVAP